MRCSGTNYTRICRQRETCQLYRAFLNTHPGAPVEIHSMPVSASEGCYMYQPASAGIREAVKRAEENQQ